MLEKELISQAVGWHDAGHAVAVAVVAQTWGSSPRPRGSRLIVRDDGEFMGSVSGGCVEGDVITAAREVLQTQKPRLLTFGVSDEMAWEAGLSCGGEIEIWLYAMQAGNLHTARTILAALSQRQGGICLTRADDGVQQTGDDDDNASGDGGLPSDVIRRARHLVAEKATAQTITTDDNRYFVEPYSPPPRLLIVGATHITQCLLPLATTAGFESVVIDPRPAWATAARFPDGDLRKAWPDNALVELNAGKHDAVITLTHDPKIDDPALITTLTALQTSSAPFYIGALGSQKTHAKRCARLQQQGVTEVALARIAAPVGLDIGAITPAEIALAIIAEVVRARRRGFQPR